MDPVDPQQGATPAVQRHGLSDSLFVERMPGRERYVLGGRDCSRRWAHVLTHFAAQMLWIQLTHRLYPERARTVLGVAATAPLCEPHHPAITTRVDLADNGGGMYLLVGWIERRSWSVPVTEADARCLWAMLDKVLFPVGWEGRTLPQHRAAQ